ncbi:MAG: T9SS type A sorting domain-containing protein [Chitinophagaceae bacterium]|nr:T9SS type A sorting domain-containing protein [Chitinophagaceae bacterium]
MKRFFYSLFFLLPCIASAQIPSSCTLTPAFQQAYSRDVNRLAIIRLYETHSADTGFIAVPQIHKDSVWEALAAVFNSSPQQETDSVFARYCIHSFVPSQTVVTVRIDTTYGWTLAWQNMQTLTGDPYIDNLLSQYGFTINNYFSFSGGQFVDLISPQEINGLAFSDSLALSPGIIYTYPGAWAGDGNDIAYSVNNNLRQLDFFLKWGDCPAGCTSAKKWSYAVNANCDVTYLGSQNMASDPWPQLVNCDLTPNSVVTPDPKSAVKIYPNPASGTLRFQVEGKTIVRANISTLQGQLIFKTTGTSSGILDIGNLSSGMYRLELIDDKGQRYTTSFMKR